MGESAAKATGLATSADTRVVPGDVTNNPYTTLSDATQPQSQNRTLRNGSARLGEGATPYKNEDTGNNRDVGATPTVVYRGRVKR